MVVWNLNDIYDIKDEEKIINALTIDVNTFEDYRKILNESLSPKEFLKILQDFEKITVTASKLKDYAELWQVENTSDSERNAHKNKITQVLTELGNKTMFFTLWFKKISEDKAKELIKDSGGYTFYLEKLRALKEYALSEPEEKIVNLKDSTGVTALVNLYYVIKSKFRWKWKGKTVAEEELRQNVLSKNPKNRIKAYDLLLSKYKDESAVLGEIYANIVRNWNNEEIVLRKFKSPISVRNLKNDVADKTVETLLNVTKKNVAVFQDYFKIKSKLINIFPLKREDIYAPYKEIKTKYAYDKAKEIVLETYKQFSEEMYVCAKKIFDANHVHSEIMPNKRGGGFCAPLTKDVIPYIMLNHLDKINNLFTMMHELGHGIHTLLSNKQTELTKDAPLPTAEIASIFGELLLAERLRNESSKSGRISLLIMLLQDQYAAIARQSYFTLFEKEAHEMIKNGATIDEVDNVYFNNLKEQFGDAVNLNALFSNEWKYILHMYEYPFYCYAYAFGNLLVLSLYNMYKKEGKSFVPKYLKMLSYGGSKSPKDILAEIGVDIDSEEFWQGGFNIIISEVKELESLCKKIIDQKSSQSEKSNV